MRAPGVSAAKVPRPEKHHRQGLPSGRRRVLCMLAMTLCLLVLPSTARATDVLFVGDSLTAGFYATSEQQSYFALTSAWLATHGYPSSTWMAVPGAKIAGADGETAQISAVGADVVVIELGTNDASGYATGQPTPGAEFWADYRGVLDAVRSARPQARLVLLGIWQQNTDRDLYDSLIASLATEYGGCYVNLESVSDDGFYTGPAGRPTYNGTSDAFHPNDAGHEAIAAAVEEAFAWQGGIVLDHGAAATSNPVVSVSVLPADQFTDITHMRLTCDLADWPAWQPFASSSVMTLPTGDGRHTVYAQFENQLGSMLPVVADTITLDTVPPATTTKADHLWHRHPVTLHFTATDNAGGSGVARTLYTIDAGPWQTLVGSTLVIPAPADHRNDGRHTVSYRSTDNAGNSEVVKSCTVKIDTRGPQTLAPRPCIVRRGFWPALSYRADDLLSPKAEITIRISDARGHTRHLIALGWQRTNQTHMTGMLVWRCRLPRGSYRYTVLARDLAGNKQSKVGSNRLIVE
jgi:lysophospholipase L1-like esterase